VVALFMSKPFIIWCPEGDLNSHSHLRPTDFKSAASADFAIRAFSDKHMVAQGLMQSHSGCSG
jgi:hypothetical protein